MIDLREAALTHEHREHLATHTARAVGDDRAILEVVECAAVEERYEVTRGLDIGYDRAGETPDLRLDLIAPVEEDDVVAAFGNEAVDALRIESFATSDDAIRVDIEFIGRTECDDFRADPNDQLREVVSDTFRPFDVDISECRVFTQSSDVAFDAAQFAADCRIDTVRGHNDPSAKIERFAHGYLPQAYRFGIRKRREDIEQHDLGGRHSARVRSAPRAFSGGSRIRCGCGARCCDHLVRVEHQHHTLVDRATSNRQLVDRIGLSELLDDDRHAKPYGNVSAERDNRPRYSHRTTRRQFAISPGFDGPTWPCHRDVGVSLHHPGQSCELLHRDQRRRFPSRSDLPSE